MKSTQDLIEYAHQKTKLGKAYIRVNFLFPWKREKDIITLSKGRNNFYTDDQADDFVEYINKRPNKRLKAIGKH